MKYFTVQEANKALVLVKPIVLDIKNKWAEVKKIKDECDAIVLNHLGTEGLLSEKEEKLDVLLGEIEGHISELQEIGVEFKGFEEGVVDFPARLSTRTIYLCWKSDEEHIGHWHEIFEGFPGRKDVTEELEEAIRTEHKAAQTKSE